MKKILFISHDASRTGAPFVLLNFFIWLKRQNRYHITVYLKSDGPLTDSFKQVADTYLPDQNTLPKRILKKITRTNRFDNQAPAVLLKQQFDLVYINTIAGIDLAQLSKKTFKCPVICHVHENDFTIKYYYPKLVTEGNLQAIDHFIAVSKSTSYNLINNYGIKPEDVSLVYEFVNLQQVKKPSLSVAQAKKELHVSEKFIVGGSGLTLWRKGVDMFVQLAVAINKLQPRHNIQFVWVGQLTDEFACQFDYEAGRLGVKEQVLFTGVKDNPQNYFQTFDVFALTSREDPFPLVALEAASLGVPIFCFEDAGGMTELVKDGENGVVVPYGAVDEMARKIVELASNDAHRIAMGKKAQLLIPDFDVEAGGPKLLSIIDNAINA